MSEDNFDTLEQRLSAIGRGFPYPPTPDISTAVRDRIEAKNVRRGFSQARLAWALAILLVLATVLFAVPPVRAQILEFLQIGAMRVFFGESTPSEAAETPPGTTTNEPGAILGEETREAKQTASGLPTVRDIVPPITLQAAQELAGFGLKAPAYPETLGSPDQVYYLNLEGPAVLTLWMDSEAPEKVYLSLLQLGPGAFAGKGAPGTVDQIEVNGEQGLWMEGAHILYLHLGETSQIVEIPVEGNILIWTEGPITYRLEGDFPLEEALRIAESLKAPP